MKKIGENYAEHKDKSDETVESLLNLGDKLLDNLEDDVVENFFLDYDFKNRTVIEIIIDNDFLILLSSEKINILIEAMWIGKQTYDCDGKLTDFSLLENMAKA